MVGTWVQNNIYAPPTHFKPRSDLRDTDCGAPQVIHVWKQHDTLESDQHTDLPPPPIQECITSGTWPANVNETSCHPRNLRTLSTCKHYIIHLPRSTWSMAAMAVRFPMTTAISSCLRPGAPLGVTWSGLRRRGKPPKRGISFTYTVK